MRIYLLEQWKIGHWDHPRRSLLGSIEPWGDIRTDRARLLQPAEAHSPPTGLTKGTNRRQKTEEGPCLSTKTTERSERPPV